MKESDLTSILQVQTDGIRTCIFVAVKYSDETRGFAHIDAFTTQDAIRRFLNNASDIKIAYAGEDWDLNNNNIKKYAQEKYNELEANYAATPQAGRKYSSLLNRKNREVEMFNIVSVLKEVENDVKVTISSLQKDRIKCAYNITNEQMICEECHANDLSYKQSAIKNQGDSVYKLGWAAEASKATSIRHKDPRISVLQGNALVSNTLDEVFPQPVSPAKQDPQVVAKDVETEDVETEDVETEDVETEDVTKLQNILQKLRENNAYLTQLSAENLISIFTDANNAGYYTRGKPKLPVDESENSRSDEQAKLMRKFSVAFQDACKGQQLYFSNTHHTGKNKHGMRTKSVVDFLKRYNGDISTLVKGAGWTK